jgi:hypothetical protein
MKFKYLGRMSIEWFHIPIKSTKICLIVWKVMVESLPLVGTWMMWRIENGKKVGIGKDPWAGADVDFRLYDDLLSLLHD